MGKQIERAWMGFIILAALVGVSVFLYMIYDEAIRGTPLREILAWGGLILGVVMMSWGIGRIVEHIFD